jgi:trans-aconitate methyltransferase
MRFGSAEHLDAWRAYGAYPRIHDAIFRVIITEMMGTRVLDLGCCYGLLAQRVLRQAGIKLAIGVDADAKAISAGAAAGIGAELLSLEVNEASLPQLIAMVTRHKIDVLIARRVLPELFGGHPELGRRFATEMRGAGIREVFLEGRVATAKAVNPLSSIEAEVEMLSAGFREVQRVGAVSYLRAL